MACDVSNEMLMALLNRAWNSAKDSVGTLRPQFLSEQASALELVSVGSISSVGKNSANQSYSTYGPGRITAAQLVESWSRLIADYDVTKTTLIAAFATGSVTIPDDYDFDSPIYDLMTKVFQSSSDTPRLPNIRELRYPEAPFSFMPA